ncbi:MAG TPA: tRNA (adenosine(37)-N6)-threonylcarbamoyltransferase complex ATPase subunit type 1 TsaE [Terriglobia bacterium]|nr:tRNA (adenosine(37)-N6)-threonylcarbamoyltransferase complex ATPase subunit type 1 TsaE [Terriglobia bacterium]
MRGCAVVTGSPEETIAFGRRLAHEIEPPCTIVLEGELGSGKTTLAKGIVAGLGAASEEEVTSPSFTLVHEYGCDTKVYHVDLYRVEDGKDLSTLGLDELLDQAVVLIEWGGKLRLAAPALRITLSHLGDERRKIVVSHDM